VFSFELVVLHLISAATYRAVCGW